MFTDKAGFGNNFATGGDKSLAQNMEAVVVGCMFKSLITRCASTTHELHSPENLVSSPTHWDSVMYLWHVFMG